MDTIDFNTHDVDIFINDTWQKYACDNGNSSKLQGVLNSAFDQRVKLHRVTSWHESTSNVRPGALFYKVYILITLYLLEY